MIRYRRLWLVALAVLLLAEGVWFIAITNSLRICDVHRVADGMTYDEVVYVLGKRPVNRTSEWISIIGEIWEAADGEIVVRFGDDGRVIGRMVIDRGLLRGQLKRIQRRYER